MEEMPGPCFIIAGTVLAVLSVAAVVGAHELLLWSSAGIALGLIVAGGQRALDRGR